MGKTGKCTKCGVPVLVEEKSSKHDESQSGDPARSAAPQDTFLEPTAKQLNFASNLGIDYPKDITRPVLSALIDEAIQRQRDEDERRTRQLMDRENEAYEEIRKRVLTDLDENDPRLSVATPKQIVDCLENRGIAAIIVSFSMDKVYSYSELDGTPCTISIPDGMTHRELATILMGAVLGITKNVDI